MLDSIREITGSGEFEDDGSVTIESATASGEDLVVGVRLTPPDGPDQLRSIVCAQPRGHRLVAAQSSERLTVCDSHVVLWPHCEPQLALHFYGRPEERLSLLGELLEAHYKATDDWIPFAKYMNDAILLPSWSPLDAGCERRLKSAARGARKVQRWVWF